MLAWMKTITELLESYKNSVLLASVMYPLLTVHKVFVEKEVMVTVSVWNFQQLHMHVFGLLWSM